MSRSTYPMLQEEVRQRSLELAGVLLLTLILKSLRMIVEILEERERVG